ncbi:DUF5044 domain-containing protein [Flavonifractor sp. An91]|uniref:DUF5044 domain-containing protein n=1 Tax=Flavonifractor sp. An91 TaxID=1965665 RepID=UPI000B37084F|nr:DUF5044 domain-containing protein [Flavonifractor sp. An91]OUN11107.1 hypothetical protein B5G42_09290 [Flavonifractor sp. An91]
MARCSVTPAQRKRRILRDALLLAIVLVVLVLRLDFPILTAEQALETTQDRYFFGPGEVITTLDYSREANKVKIGQYDRYYILRHGDWYAWCGINRRLLLFWQTGELGAVENDPDLPLVPLIVSNQDNGIVLVISNDPEITQVEITFPISAETKQGYTLLSASQTQSTENCFLISYTSGPGFVFPEDLQVKGYDAAGALRYQSPIPESWATHYELR